jgi:hypothetical protein
MKLEAWTKRLLDKYHPCNENPTWEAGPVGIYSRLFTCSNCKSSFIVHLGRVVPHDHWKNWEPRKPFKKVQDEKSN